MVEKPPYFDSWKGRIARAIVNDNARTWIDLREATGLAPKALNRVIAEMISGGGLEKKKDSTYRLEYGLFKQYQEFYNSLTDKQRSADKIRIKESDQKALIQWVDNWKSEEAPSV